MLWFKAGIEAVSEARRWADKIGERYYEPELFRIHAGLLLQKNEPSLAESELIEAINIAKRRGPRMWQLRALSNLVELKNNFNPEKTLMKALTRGLMHLI